MKYNTITVDDVCNDNENIRSLQIRLLKNHECVLGFIRAGFARMIIEKIHYDDILFFIDGWLNAVIENMKMSGVKLCRVCLKKTILSEYFRKDANFCDTCGACLSSIYNIGHGIFAHESGLMLDGSISLMYIHEDKIFDGGIFSSFLLISAVNDIKQLLTDIHHGMVVFDDGKYLLGRD